MIKTRSCPRCNGAVLEYVAPEIDSPSCVNCGWRATDIPPDVQEQVEAHLGKPYSEERYIHSNIGTGKAPLSPNPPKDTDGRREESGRGVRELQGK